MATILSTKSYYFNDVNLLPGQGKVRSRKNVPKELERVIVSPMLAVVGPTFAKEAAKLGLSITTPRFLPMKDRINIHRTFENNKINDRQLCFLSIGLSEKDEDLVLLSKELINSILIDIAFGGIPHLEESVYNLTNYIKLKNLMVGNIVTADGLTWLTRLVKYCDSLFIRIGIGNGSACTSSDETGINRGQITEAMECRARLDYLQSVVDQEKFNNVFLISDGGIKKPGFAIKAMAAGADYVMMGGYFSTAVEAETHISMDGEYFGCASEKQNQLAGLDKHAEGQLLKVNKSDLKPLSQITSQLWGSLSSAVSYMGYRDLSECIGNGVFEAKQNSLPPKKRY